MELMQLEMFVAVAEEGSVHKAADKVCRTQPAVSIALKKLAIEVGSPLFDRKHRFDYHLTPTGEILYSYATRLLSLRNEAVAALRDLARHRGAVTDRSQDVRKLGARFRIAKAESDAPSTTTSN
jgi:DNA-binding transcriptional LysR family regulator